MAFVVRPSAGLRNTSVPPVCTVCVLEIVKRFGVIKCLLHYIFYDILLFFAADVAYLE